MSRKTSSSAPSVHRAAQVRPGHRRRAARTKETPFTTRPLSTSKQGMIRRVSTLRLSSEGLAIVEPPGDARGAFPWLRGSYYCVERFTEGEGPLVERLAND